MRYHALVLHRADPDDAFWVPVQPLRRIARAMVSVEDLYATVKEVN